MARTRVGLDIGSSHVRAAEISVGGTPSLVRVGQVPLPPGAVQRGEVRTPEAVAESIRELWRRGGFSAREVAIGVGNQRVVVREVTLPSLPDKELRESLPYQVQDLVPIPLDEAVLDYDKLEELEVEGRQMARLLVVAAQREMLEAHIRAVTDARLEPIGVDLIPFCLVRSIGEYGGMGLDESEGGGEAVVDVGADLTNICVHERGLPRFVRILPSGGQEVTRSIAGTLGISEEQAEIVQRGGSIAPAVPDETAGEAVRSQAATLADEVRSSLDFYRAQTPTAQVSQLRVSGGGSKLPGFVEVLGERTGVPAQRGRPLAKFEVAVALDPADLAEAEPLIAVAVGLAMPQEEGME